VGNLSLARCTFSTTALAIWPTILRNWARLFLSSSRRRLSEQEDHFVSRLRIYASAAHRAKPITAATRRRRRPTFRAASGEFLPQIRLIFWLVGISLTTTPPWTANLMLERPRRKQQKSYKWSSCIVTQRTLNVAGPERKFNFASTVLAQNWAKTMR